MPRVTRQRRLRQAWECGTFPAIFELMEQDENDVELLLLSYFRSHGMNSGKALLQTARLHHDHNSENLRTLLLTLISSRYLEPRLYLPRCTNWITAVLPAMKDDSFKYLMRMSRRDFAEMLHRIENGPGRKIFENLSRNKQVPISLQFSMALLRFGFSGNAAAALNISLVTRCSIGAVNNAYRRVTRALMLMAEDEIRWPSREERMSLRVRAARHGFPFAFFAVDGTTVPLFEKPCVDHEAFFDRKSNYSLNALIACDWNRTIINIVVGYPGSVHDNRVLRGCRYMQERHDSEFFSSHGHGLGDSAFAAFKRLVPPYKMPAAAAPGNLAFNNELATLRIIVEHCIGLLKGRFQSLKELRLRILEKADLVKCCEHIIACVVLHNMLIRIGSDCESFEEDPEGINEDPLIISGTAEDCSSASLKEGEHFRAYIKGICLEHLGFVE